MKVASTPSRSQLIFQTLFRVKLFSSRHETAMQDAVVTRECSYTMYVCMHYAGRYIHGRRKDFSQGGATSGFFQRFFWIPKVFLDFSKGGTKSTSHSKLRKQPFLLKFSKSRGSWGQGPLTPLGRPRVHRTRDREDESTHATFSSNQAQNYWCKSVASITIIYFSILGW